MLRALKLAGITASLTFGGSVPSFADIYTLYRSSVLDAAMRIHVATFDAEISDDYNSENCEVAKSLFQDQDGVSVRYWCEKGRYKR